MGFTRKGRRLDMLCGTWYGTCKEIFHFERVPDHFIYLRAHNASCSSKWWAIVKAIYTCLHGGDGVYSDKMMEKENLQVKQCHVFLKFSSYKNVYTSLFESRTTQQVPSSYYMFFHKVSISAWGKYYPVSITKVFNNNKCQEQKRTCSVVWLSKRKVYTFL